MATSEERKKQLLRAGEESKIAAEWMASHVEDYVQSAKNAKVIGDFLDQNGLPFTHENLEKGFVWAKSFGWAFTKTNESAAPPVVPTPTPAVPAVPVEEPLPPVPLYMERIKTSKDIRDIPPEIFTKWRRGPDRDAFFSRLEAIKQRGL